MRASSKSIPLLERTKLFGEKLDDDVNVSWNFDILAHILEKARHIRDTLRSNETELRQVPADRVDQLRPLPNKQIASSVNH